MAGELDGLLSLQGFDFQHGGRFSGGPRRWARKRGNHPRAYTSQPPQPDPPARARPKNPSRFTDQTGLDAAYATCRDVIVSGDTLYVSGAKHAESLLDIALRPWTSVPHLLAGDLQDAWDDAKVPFGLTRYSDRYRKAESLLLANPQITKVVGHSLGSSVTLELSQTNPERNLDTRVYGSPALSLPYAAKPERYRHPGDLVSILDLGARTEPNPVNWNPHSYEGFSTSLVECPAADHLDN